MLPAGVVETPEADQDGLDAEGDPDGEEGGGAS